MLIHFSDAKLQIINFIVQFSDTLVYLSLLSDSLVRRTDRNFIMIMGKNELVGQSAAMRDVRRLIEIAAPAKTTVLVLGRSVPAGACGSVHAQSDEKANWFQSIVQRSQPSFSSPNYSVMKKALYWRRKDPSRPV